MDAMRKWLTVAEVARITGLSKAHLYRMLEADKIKGARRFDTAWRIPRRFVECDGEEAISKKKDRQ